VDPQSVELRALFIIISVAVAVLFVALIAWAGVRLKEPPRSTRTWALLGACAAAVWMAFWWLVAASGALAEFDRRPPPFVFMLFAVFAISAAIAFSPLGKRLAHGVPLAALVAFQSFRLPLELVMHRAAEEGVMPEQMSYSGWNYDILTGASALVVAMALQRGAPLGLARAWNVMGALLLANILIIAMVSTPLFAAFGPDRLNTWVADPPFVWLPTVMVVLAISGHLVIWRALGGQVGQVSR
jgi:hypothetical protein